MRKVDLGDFYYVEVDDKKREAFVYNSFGKDEYMGKVWLTETGDWGVNYAQGISYLPTDKILTELRRGYSPK